MPGPAWGAAADAHGRFGPVLFALAVLVVAAKLGGLLAGRLGQPSVLGELLVGIGLGNLLPLAFGQRGVAFFQSEPTLLVLAEIGVLILLFDVGLEADLRALIRVGWSSLAVALTGILAPLLLGWGAASWLMPNAPTLAHVFVGATLSATSVGITARVLKDLGVAQTREGQIILGAAVIDDILGLVVLAVVSGAATAAPAGGSGLSILGIGGIVVRAVLFLGIIVGLGHKLSEPIVRMAARTGQHGILLVFGLALCFSLAFAAELVGLADIIGAFAAGLMLDPYGEGIRSPNEEATLSELMHPLSSLFVPLFFVLMGIQVHLGSLLDRGVLGLGAALIVCALAGKLACAFVVGGRWVDRLAVGIGMIPRGEVGLIFAGIGSGLTVQAQPILSQGVFSAVVLMVLVTTLLAPVGLRWVFRRAG
ncbi:MAG: cation:proton antiporter [candidate division NC10 bacterium]|nr:cation:proton antiporter [candidate division NC10 bacterium]